MNEWERRLANVIGIEVQPEPKAKAPSLSFSRSPRFIITNTSNYAVELSIPVFEGPATGSSPALTTVRQKLRNGSMKMLLPPRGAAVLTRAVLVKSMEIQQLVERGILRVDPE